jgi:hypothetical protein
MLTRLPLPRLVPLALTLTAFALPVSAQTSIRGVTLSTSGLALIEAVGQMGPEPLRLSVPRSHIDDFLKSLWLLDPAGAAAHVTLTGPGAREDAFARLPLSPEDATDPARLLRAMVGAPLRVTRRGETREGIVLGVTQRPCEHGPCMVLNLLGDDGTTRSFEMSDALDFTLTDPADRAVVAQALAALRGGANPGAVAVALHSADPAPREAGLVYLQAAPVWRTAWRAVDTPEGLQLTGWAVVENTTGQDWEDVRLTLATGAVRAIRARLYDRQHVAREEAAVPLAAPMVLQGAPMMRGMAMAEGLADFAPAVAEIEADDGESFSRFTLLEPVTLAAGQMISVPFLRETLPDARLTLYRGGSFAEHPQIALDLVNPLPLRLPAGVLTLYEDGRGHAGDALIPELAPGAREIVSFARDTAIRVREAESRVDTLREARLQRGVLLVTEDLVRTTTYRIEGAAAAERSLTLDHPRDGAWVIETAGGTETADAWRWQITVPAAGRVEHVVTERQPRQRNVVLMDIDTPTLAAWTARVTQADTRQTLEQFIRLRGEIAQAETALRETDARGQRLESEQTRLVNLIVQLGDDSSANRDRRARVDAIDIELAALETERVALRDAITTLRDRIAALING